MTRYRWGSRAILQNSAASSLNLGLLSASIIQPGEEKDGTGDEEVRQIKIKLEVHLYHRFVQGRKCLLLTNCQFIGIFFEGLPLNFCCIVTQHTLNIMTTI